VAAGGARARTRVGPMRGNERGTRRDETRRDETRRDETRRDEKRLASRHREIMD
jgi:hypothetical protein